MLSKIKRIVKYILYGVPVKNVVTANIGVIAPNEMLKGKTALVTGGTSGIGKAIAQAFLNSGAKVIITGRNQEKADKVCREIKGSDDTPVFAIELDNTVPESFSKKIQEILALPGVEKIDILVNNAGLLGGDISNTSIEEFDKVVDTNLRGSFFLSRDIAHYMINNGIRGNILNIASSSSLRPAASAYTLSKWGLRGMTLGLAKTLSPYGIVVNGIAPGPTATPMLKKDASDIAFDGNPAGRYAMPDEIANMAVMLTSSMGRMVVGDIVYMTGGSGLITFDDIEYKF